MGKATGVAVSGNAMVAVRGAALAVRFGLELVIYVAVALGAGALDLPIVARVVIAIAAVVVVGAVWGLMLSPRARVALSPAVRLALEGIVWLIAAAALFAAGHPLLAAIFLVIVIIDSLALRLTAGISSPLETPRRP